MIIARAIRALALQMKWTMLRYAPFEPRLWASIGELYRYAETAAAPRAPLTIYPGAAGLRHGSAGISQDDDAVGVQRRRPLAAQAGYRRTDSRLRRKLISSSRRSPFPARSTVSTRRGTSARCACSPSRQRPNLYYFGPGDAAAKLSRIIPVLEKTGTLPSGCEPRRARTPEKMVARACSGTCVIYWSDEPPARASERRRRPVASPWCPGISSFSTSSSATTATRSTSALPARRAGSSKTSVIMDMARCFPQRPPIGCGSES